MNNKERRLRNLMLKHIDFLKRLTNEPKERVRKLIKRASSDQQSVLRKILRSISCGEIPLKKANHSKLPRKVVKTLMQFRRRTSAKRSKARLARLAGYFGLILSEIISR